MVDQSGLSESLNTVCLFQTWISVGQSSLSAAHGCALRSSFHALQTTMAIEVIWFGVGGTERLS